MAEDDLKLLTLLSLPLKFWSQHQSFLWKHIAILQTQATHKATFRESWSPGYLWTAPAGSGCWPVRQPALATPPAHPAWPPLLSEQVSKAELTIKGTHPSPFCHSQRLNIFLGFGASCPPFLTLIVILLEKNQERATPLPAKSDPRERKQTSWLSNWLE